MDAAVPDEPPIVARRRVRLALREARKARNLSQVEVADAMEWSAAKVMRIETGEVSISPNDLKPLLTFLGIKDREQVEALVRHAKAARSRAQWWDQPKYRAQLTPATRQLIQYEMEATAISHFAEKFIPGPLQTRAYARAIIARWRDDLQPGYLDALLDARNRRRRQFFARKPPPLLRILLDESLLYRPIGSPQTLAEQLDDLLSVAESHDARVRVMPYSVEGPISNVASFDILHLGQAAGGDEESSADAIVYRENYKDDMIIEDTTEVARHIEIFDNCWGASLDEPTSAEMIRDRTRHLL